MTAPGLELQAEIVAAVENDAALMALINGIYDRVPDAPWGIAQGYISFGDEDEVAEICCTELTTVSVPLHVWSRRTGRVHCKQILHELKRVLRSVNTTENPIVARTDPVGQVYPDLDGLTTHGFVRYEFTMEVAE